jgi:hypothetical protein
MIPVVGRRGELKDKRLQARYEQLHKWAANVGFTILKSIAPNAGIRVKRWVFPDGSTVECVENTNGLAPIRRVNVWVPPLPSGGDELLLGPIIGFGNDFYRVLVKGYEFSGIGAFVYKNDPETGELLRPTPQQIEDGLRYAEDQDIDIAAGRLKLAIYAHNKKWLQQMRVPVLDDSNITSEAWWYRDNYESYYARPPFIHPDYNAACMVFGGTLCFAGVPIAWAQGGWDTTFAIYGDEMYCVYLDDDLGLTVWAKPLRASEDAWTEILKHTEEEPWSRGVVQPWGVPLNWHPTQPRLLYFGDFAQTAYQETNPDPPKTTDTITVVVYPPCRSEHDLLQMSAY